MGDGARSENPAVQRQLSRLYDQGPGRDILGLERIGALCHLAGNPQHRLPPVFHVSGTNGKGSTCAFLRAALEASGKRVHVYTSPHLVSFNERIRIAGKLISDEMLSSILEEVMDLGAGIGGSFFEVTTCAAFLAFSRVSADACVIEVGLGGRLDATNVIPVPLVAGIAQLGMDHREFLGETIEQVAAEKAGIAKPGGLLVTQRYPDTVAASVNREALKAGSLWLPRGSAWDWAETETGFRYRDESGEIDLPRPALAGSHQATNAALAVAMLRHQRELDIPEAALREAMARVDWPARMQKLSPGPLVNMLPEGANIWIDGCHNAPAANAVADFLNRILKGKKLPVVMGVLARKDPIGMLAALAPHISELRAIPVPGHAHHDPAALADIARSFNIPAEAAQDHREALASLATGFACSDVLFIVSLYLAGEILRDNKEKLA